MNGLEAEKLYIRRGAFLLSDVNLALPEGKTGVVLGGKGSGKSTLLEALSGALDVLSGVVRYRGRELCEAEEQIKREMSVVYDTPNFNMELSGRRLFREWIKFEPWMEPTVFAAYIKRLGLDERTRIRLLSPKQQYAMMLALALCRRPAILLLDDPVRHMDSGELWELVSDYRREHMLTLLYTTHREEELLRADRIWLLENGACREG